MNDWTHWQSFLAVIDTGSLSAAANQVGATQPTLGRHIKALEESLGVPLFLRTVRGLEPNEAALSLVDDARAMGVAAGRLALKAAGKTETLAGSVRITGSVVMCNLVLPAIVADLRREEPLIQIEIVASDRSQNLLRRDADIALRMFDPTQQALVARRLGETPLGLYGAKSYLERRGRPQTLGEMLGHDIIGFDRDDAMLKGFAAQGAVVTREQFPLRCDDQMVDWHLLLAGAGLGIAQRRLGDAQTNLERLDVGLTLPVLPIWLVMHEDVRSNARIRRVADFLSQRITSWLM
ncbi:bacterial regulatory helix-turn-helix protein, lysR family protein [Asticcacaulis biprosthecium C19]|uniref:Bacterial regulatory helix-turn-helix protein, lysR family protein n=1 Tax=Asticcacaulis biprosthecium C19 TaxID=715226 RepID=F4QLL2_9CAUL|nr:LysR family transcriptional regulator [Asticcacaulis biprosthecium]EGF93510.1 bacterial regulatory helix-turn-helix protein, lysR family protein [Asticcacaulis biprosthecium C19]